VGILETLNVGQPSNTLHTVNVEDFFDSSATQVVVQNKKRKREVMEVAEKDDYLRNLGFFSRSEGMYIRCDLEVLCKSLLVYYLNFFLVIVIT